MPRCDFKHNGKPTTKPGTEEDAERIILPKKLTAILVFNGDEKQGAYQTPDIAADMQAFIARISRDESTD